MTEMPLQPEPIHAVERAWMRFRALSTESMDDTVESVFQYALRLAGIRELVQVNGQRIWMDGQLETYRQKLGECIRSAAKTPITFSGGEALEGVGTLAWQGSWKKKDILAIYPEVKTMLQTMISQLKERFGQLCNEDFEHTLAQKKLVLALGGGGGTGFVHLCLFQYLEELGIRPSLMTGTSIGALLGFVRALQDNYDAARAVLKLPGLWDLTKCIHPCFGTGTHGLMGLCRIDISSIIENISKSCGWSSIPNLNELKIPFACVSSGILSNSDIVHDFEHQSRNPLMSLLRMTHLTWRRAMQHAAQIAELIVTRNAVSPVVFGVDELTRDMPGCDAISFSMLVPGVLNYELPEYHYRSREILNRIFKMRGLYRLADGGLASNVPVRAAYTAVRQKRIEHENVYILGMDVFAPQHGDGVFYPLQKIANENARIDAGYADSFVRLKYLLSPMNLVPSLVKMHWLNDKFKKTFAPEMKIIQYALKPLAPLELAMSS